MNPTVRKITELLDSSDLELRIAAVRVITEVGLQSKQSIQALGRCLREPHDELRLAALKGLARLGASDVISMVVPLLLASGPLREHAMAVIAAVGGSVVPQLRALYPQADFHGKRTVITALARIGTKEALGYLLKILPDEPFEIQKHLTFSLCEAMDRMTSATQVPLLSMVLRLVRDKKTARQPQILVTGAILLGHVRGAALAAKARGELRVLAEKRFPPEVRRHATLSISRLITEGKLSQADQQFIFQALCDEDWHNVAQHALQGLQRMELEPKFHSKLIDLLHRSPHFSVHIHIFERLQTSDRPEVAQTILPFLADARFRVREAAETALRKMPTSIESLFLLLMKTDDLEVTQRINAILRDFPQETRVKYVDRAISRLLALFDENDPHYKSFLEFVKNVDPDPLRKKIYEKAQHLKRTKAKNRWERIAALVQLLWDNHLITAEGRYYLAVALVRLSPKDLAPAARRSNLGLRVLRSLVYDDHEDLAKRLRADPDLTPEDFYYLGFHFSEEGEELRPFAASMLDHVVKKYPRSSVAGAAAHKLQLQAKAEAQPALDAAAKKAASRAAAAEKAAAKAAAKAAQATAVGGKAPGDTRPAAAAAPASIPGKAAPGKPAAPAKVPAATPQKVPGSPAASIAKKPVAAAVALSAKGAERPGAKTSGKVVPGKVIAQKPKLHPKRKPSFTKAHRGAAKRPAAVRTRRR